MKHLQGEIKSSTIRFEGFNIPLLMIIEHIERTAIRRKSILNNYHTNLRDTYRTLTIEYPIFSRVHGIFSRLDPILGHNKFQKIEVLHQQYIKINNKSKTGTVTNILKLVACCRNSNTLKEN